MPSEIANRKFCGQACAGASRRGVKKAEWVSLTCAQCSGEFKVTPAWVRNGRRRFCTKKCHAAFWAHNIDRTGKVHTPESRAAMSEKAQGRYVRERSSQWKGGQFIDTSGYRHVMVATLPEPARTLCQGMAQRGYVQEHRAVMAAALGRPLTRDEIVHHENGEKADNRPENLSVVGRSAHSIAHREVERELFRLRVEVADLRSRLGPSLTDGATTS